MTRDALPQAIAEREKSTPEHAKSTPAGPEAGPSGPEAGPKRRLQSVGEGAEGASDVEGTEGTSDVDAWLASLISNASAPAEVLLQGYLAHKKAPLPRSLQ